MKQIIVPLSAEAMKKLDYDQADDDELYIETFAKFLLPPNSRNLNKDFRLFLFQISTDSTQISP